MGVDRDRAEPVWFTVNEAARILRVDRDTLYDLIASNGISHRRVGRQIRIPYSAVYPTPTDTPATAV